MPEPKEKKEICYNCIYFGGEAPCVSEKTVCNLNGAEMYNNDRAATCVMWFGLAEGIKVIESWRHKED